MRASLRFELNEAWIVFRLNEQPIPTEQDGVLDFLALMDAASRFILGVTPVAVGPSGPTPLEAKRLLRDGKTCAACSPRTLIVPTDLVAPCVIDEAERLGIELRRVEAEQLVAFIGEAQQGFRERFGGRDAGQV